MVLFVNLREKLESVMRFSEYTEENLTWTKNLEYGSPPSRAKAHVRRETEATTPIEEVKPMEVINAIIAVAAFIDPVD